MGYYSYFAISVDDRRQEPKDSRPDSEQPEDVARETIASLREYSEEAELVFDDAGFSSEGAKWYGWIEEMMKFSAEHPGLLLTVRRDGEESGDIEVRYFLDGEHQGGAAEIVLPKFVEPEK